MTLRIRTFGDPVLRQPRAEITEIDEPLIRLVNDMIETMYAAPGVGLAAQQVGVLRRLFVYDVGDGPGVVINPVIHKTEGEWEYEEGCLSVPGLFFPIKRSNYVHLSGLDLDGNEIELEGNELLGRVFQHECDHLEGTLVIDRLDVDTRKQAMRVLRERAMGTPGAEGRPRSAG